MNLRPLHDRVVVKRVEEETTTPGGIVLPGFICGGTGSIRGQSVQPSVDQ